MKKVRDNAAVPRGGAWIWKHAETGHVLSHPYYNQIKQDVKKFLQANNYPIGSNFEDDFEQNICANADPAMCMEWVPPSIFEKMSTLSQTLLITAQQIRDPLVSAEVVEERQRICESCNFYGGSRAPLKIACRKCGCTGLALYLAAKHCPLENPKW